MGAQNATLTFMVGGSKSDMARAEPFILQMGKRVVHCGNIGAGQVAKISNNMLLAITMIGVSEAMNLGIRYVLQKEIERLQFALLFSYTIFQFKTKRVLLL